MNRQKCSAPWRRFAAQRRERTQNAADATHARWRALAVAITAFVGCAGVSTAAPRPTYLGQPGHLLLKDLRRIRHGECTRQTIGASTTARCTRFCLIALLSIAANEWAPADRLW